jgi:hypothetical protein
MLRGMKLGGLVLGCLWIAGCGLNTVASSSGGAPQSLEVAEARFKDPLQRFSIMVPEGWEVISYKEPNSSGLMVTVGPLLAGPASDLVDTWVHAEPAQDLTTEQWFEHRRRRLENAARRSDGASIYREVTTGRIPTESGEALYHVYDSGLPGSKARYFDAYIVADDMAWNVGGGADPQLWAKHRENIEKVVKSFRLENAAPLARHAPVLQMFFPFLLPEPIAEPAITDES